MNQRKQRKVLRESKNLPRGSTVFFEREGLTEKTYLQKLHLIIKYSGLDIAFDYGNDNGGQSPKVCVKNLIDKKKSQGRDGDLFIAICDVDDFDKKKKNGNPSDLKKAADLAK